MTWQKRLRGVIGLAVIASAVTVYFLSKKPKPAPPRAPEALTDQKATSEGLDFKVERQDDNKKKIVFALSADKYADYPDQSTQLNGHVHLKSTRDDKPIDVWADSAFIKGKKEGGDKFDEVLLKGHVRVLDDTLELLTDEATHLDALGETRTPGKTSFKKGRMSGNGIGSTYSRNTRVLWLLQESHVQMVPDADGGGERFTSSADAIGLFRNDKYLRLERSAKIDREHETLSADMAVLNFTDDEKDLRLAELRGNSGIVPIGDPNAAPPEMHADDITMTFYPGSRNVRQATLVNNSSLIETDANGKRSINANFIDVTTATDGRTLIGLNAKDRVVAEMPQSKDSPARKITATALTARGTEKEGLRSAKFEGGVHFRETPLPAPARGGSTAARPGAGDRHGYGDALVLALNGSLDNIESAEFQQRARFEDGSMTGTADIAKYSMKKNELLLLPNPREPRSTLRVSDDSVEVAASDSILISTETHDIVAIGLDLYTTMKPSKERAADRKAALFDPDAIVRGQASWFRYLDATRTASYKGSEKKPAKVWQENNNEVRADTIDIEDETGNLTASGRLQTTFMLDASETSATPGAKPEPPKEHHLKGKSMTYRDAERKAVYFGDDETPATLDGPETDLKAKRIDVYLGQAERRVDRVEGHENAYASLPNKRRGFGAELLFDTAAGKYTLKGIPGKFAAQLLLQPEPGKTDCKLQSAMDLWFSRSGAWDYGSRTAQPDGITKPCDFKLGPPK